MTNPIIRNGRSLEERIKFDHGLTIGRHLVLFTLGEHSRVALVEIGPRGAVSYLAKPGAGDMYSSWSRIKGDDSSGIQGAVIVWGARDPELMRMFDGEPVATIPVQV
ncbi:hypothetical protein DFO67_1359 [Modicisalibacter xianhensis]|uniref:Uncharacterized protein n=1 Tax=Modicisalibacter xianhensis TaxID=442341 RepID=A0A4R8F871_9GAMM|nr:hypothetical protein [Halomonas xianhensis]TDX21599.1 hypothetical protein DFO67_1359 [Halomonas xianhensis]